MKTPLIRFVPFAALLALSPLVSAQWVQETHVLKPGWNAVFLGVSAEPTSCDSLFAGLPVESVWDFNPTVDSPQFVQDPSTLIPGSPGWLTWFPPPAPSPARAICRSCAMADPT
jgi:hypothetical protein